MEQPDSCLKPLIGYAMWHMLRGESVEQILDRFYHSKKYRNLPPEDWSEAIRYAMVNVIATRRAQEVYPTPSSLRKK